MKNIDVFIGKSNDNVKRIFIISDGTGQSAINLMRACLIQFEEHNIRFTIYPKINTTEQIDKVLKSAREHKGFVAFTLVKKELRKYMHELCHEYDIMHFDILGPPVEKLSKFLNAKPLENPNLLRRVDDKYFKRIEAIEFTINHDDGKNLKGLNEADIVILGLSRVSKTPTSFYLAQLGYKVVNIPIVPEIPLPKELFKIDQRKIVCLVMDPEVLQKVRQERMKHYRGNNNYTDLRRIFEELEFVYDLVKKNRQWHIVDTTNKSVEETAREIISSIYGREQEFF
ncbi:kinase/pyrophosphorylase [Deferribacter autotrophicus]|uniref:Putative pyruvate, phosphate dikinase regulatory protein n=1 Tax=Deferribacter autotrophicus TaxID=500465 RepID=A0A5A8F2A2_9BACT|nr:pyruvate, water dikinase regulatory protein [Deferribacter autotrophicus]KAA0257035.1 kinase/pyrophosphorylase [Deferribacter autotrophicus]